MSNFKQYTYELSVPSHDVLLLEDVVAAYLHTVLLQRTLDDAVSTSEIDFSSLPKLSYVRLDHTRLTQQIQGHIKSITSALNPAGVNGDAAHSGGGGGRTSATRSRASSSAARHAAASDVPVDITLSFYPASANPSDGGSTSSTGIFSTFKSFLTSEAVKQPPLEVWTLRLHRRTASTSGAASAANTEQRRHELEHNVMSMLSFLSVKAAEELSTRYLESHPAERYELTLTAVSGPHAGHALTPVQHGSVIVSL